MLKRAGDWVIDKFNAGIMEDFKSGMMVLGEDIEEVFALGFMIGLFLTIIGGKKLGTKVSSISFIAYLVIKVVLSI